MQVRFRPISTWPGERTPPYARRSRYTFRAGWSDTLNKLQAELEHLEAREVVIEADLSEDDIRLDGWPRAHARMEDPGVVVSFESSHGPLRYPCDTFESWQANVRAIALGLEALRKVERYGITSHGEQYTGWKALGAGGPVAMGAGEAMTRGQAARFIAMNSAAPSPAHVAAEPDRWYRDAAKGLHPDHGGDAENFRRLQVAREALR